MDKIIDTYYRENYDDLVKKLTYRLGNTQNAEDAVQEAFTRAIKYYESCNVDFTRWFRVLLSNVIKDAQKDLRMAGLTKNIDDVVEELEPIIPNHVKDYFRNHVDRLSGEKKSYNKEIIRLHVLFGYTTKEVSEALGLSHSTVRNSLVEFTKEVKEIYG